MTYAYTAIIDADGYSIGRADVGTKGYTPVPTEGNFDTYEAATDRANAMNLEMGLEPKDAIEIVMGTMYPRKPKTYQDAVDEATQHLLGQHPRYQQILDAVGEQLGIACEIRQTGGFVMTPTFPNAVGQDNDISITYEDDGIGGWCVGVYDQGGDTHMELGVNEAGIELAVQTLIDEFP